MGDAESRDGDKGRCAEGRALLDARELARLRAGLPAGDVGTRARIRRLATERAMLELAGERGYTAVTVEDLVERAGSNRAYFYAEYGRKERCFELACEAAGEALCERLLARCEEAGEDWARGMAAALEELGRLVAGEPAVLAALLVQAGAAGAAMAAKREELLGRLSHAIDRARRETIGSRHAPPPITPLFILSAIEASVVGFLGDPDPAGFERRLAALLFLSVDYYQGRAAARAAVGRWSAADEG